MATDQDRNNPAKILTNQNNLAAFGFKLVIDGTPSFHFQRTFTKPFLNAIGRIVCDGFSLRDTYDGNSAANMSGGQFRATFEGTFRVTWPARPPHQL